MTDTIHALIVDADPAGRALLREVLDGIPTTKTVNTVVSLEQAAREMEREGFFDVVFVSEGLGEEQVGAFLKRAKSGIMGRDAAYVLLLSEELEACKLSALLLQGCDAVLVRPYSFEAVVEVVGLARRVHLERQGARLKLGLRTLVVELRNQLDRLSSMRRGGFSAAVTERVLREMSEVVRSFDGELREEYFETLVENFSKSRPAPDRRRIMSDYRGASRRVHERAALKALEHVKRALAA